MKFQVRFGTVVLLGVLAIAGCAGSPSTTGRSMSASRDADHLLAAALHTWAVGQDAADALRLAGQAAAVAPSRPEIAVLQIRLCAQVARCDPQPLEVRLKKLAPDNAVVWLSVLARAQAEKDNQVEEQVLAEIGRSAQLDIYWTTLVSRIASALHASATPRSDAQTDGQLTSALNDATGWLSSLLLPAFEPISAACGADWLRAPARRANCERVAQVLQKGDSYAAEGLGLGIELRLADQSSMSALQVERRIDTLSYRNQTAGAVMAAQPKIEQDKFSTEVVDLMKQLPREQDVSLAILRWAGKPLRP